MKDPVQISPVDVQRAKLLVRLNEALGDPSPGYVLKLAGTRVAPSNGTSPGRNGSHAD